MKLTTFAQIGVLVLASTAAFAQDDARLATIDAALAGGDAVAGEKIFKKCKACHMIGEGAKSRTGPILTDVVGRHLGAIEGFKYSKGMLALSEEGTVWSIENLEAFLTKPKDFVTKTKMSFPGLKKDADRANLIAYLATFAAVAE